MLNFNENTMVEVFNNSEGSVGYKTDKIARTWSLPNTMKRVKLEEIYEVCNTKGGRAMLEDGTLLIKDSEIRETLGLNPLTKYVVTTAELQKIFTQSKIEDLEELLQYCSESIFEKIIALAISLPLQDMEKLNLIKRYSGIDIYSIIQDKVAEGEVSLVRTPVATKPEGDKYQIRKRVVKG